MPRYMQVTPTFTPMSYEERIKPLEQYKQEYDKQMDTLDEQGMLADAIGGLIDESKDPELAQIYQNFNTTMNSVAGELLRTGKLGNTRQGLRELRKAYANQLVPIQTAYNDRAEQAKAYREMVAKDPTYIGTDPLEHSLKDYMHGNKPNDKSVSGTQLYAMGQADAKAASSRRVLRDKWHLDSSLGSQYFSQMIREGWSQAEVEDALAQLSDGTASEGDIKEASEAVRYLQEARQRIANAYRIGDFDDNDKIAQSDAFIMNGLLSGMTYKEDVDYKSYNPKFWDGVGSGDSGGDKDAGIFKTWETTPIVMINGKVEDETELAQLLSDLRMGKATLDTASSHKVEDYSMIPKDQYGNPMPYSNSFLPYVQQSYGDRIYDLAKGLGEVPEGKTKEDFLNDLRNGSKEDFDATLAKIGKRIQENAQLYREARSNFTDNKYWVQTVNQGNATMYGEKGKIKQKGTSFIKDARGNDVESIPEGGHYILPVRFNERKGIAYQVGEGKDARRYYIKPQLFDEAVVQLNINGVLYGASLPDAIQAYYDALEAKDGNLATDIRKGIMNTLGGFNVNKTPTQSGTSSKMNPIG